MKLNRILIVVVVITFVFLNTPAQAVLKTIVVTGPGGQPVPNTEVSIFDETGKEVGKAKTDEKGGLAYDFPKGMNTLKWPGGSQVVEIGFWTPTTIAIATGLGLAGGTAALIASNNSGGSGGSSGSSGGSSGGNSSVPSTSQIAGTYNSMSTRQSITSACPADQFAPTGSGSVQFSTSGSTLTIHSHNYVVGTYNSSTGYFSGTGTIPDTSVREDLVGYFTISGSTITFTATLTYTFTSGCIAVYRITYTRTV